jgi:hypothetical protein
MKPVEHDTVMVNETLRGVVVAVTDRMALVFSRNIRSNASIIQLWYQHDRLKIVARWRSQLTGDEPDELRIIER